MNDTQKFKNHANVVVIGGGVAGCSVLYHLTQEGITDAILVERDSLTSGSTWHAAAQVTQFGGNQTMLALKKHSLQLYQKLSADPLHPFYHHITGGMRTAYTQNEIDIYKHHISLAAVMGIDMEFISTDEALKRHPLLTGDGILGAWWDPLDGYVDPSGLTHSLARHAKQHGATIYQSNPVQDITIKRNGEFIVHTKMGDITCEKIVNAAGYRVNEVGNMIGVTHPVTSMEHMYFLTEDLPALQELDYQVPVIRDPHDDFYSRQEKKGLLVGIYEQNCKTFGMNGIDPHFTKDLCPSDLDRCLDNMEGIFERMPCLQEAGIHTVINGPITYTIDGLPLVGQVPNVPNAYCCIGLRAGIGEGGGHGKILAQIIKHGEAEWDSWCLDPRRFTSYANLQYTSLKAIEDYQNEFHYHMPHEQRPAARQARTTPLYETLSREKAAWGVVNGWERALFFKPADDFIDEVGFRFNATKQVVADEVKHLQQHVSMMEVSGFNRYEIRGEGASAFLDKMICGTLPKAIGKVNLCYLLNENGHVLCEATIAKLADNVYWYGSAAASEWHDLDWLNRYKPESVSITPLTQSHTILVLAGAKTRALLNHLSAGDNDEFSAQNFPNMRAKWVQLAHAEIMAMSVSFSGEDAFELHIPNEQLYLTFQLLREAGKQFQLGLFGLYATESMRLEKGYLHWKADLIYEHNPYEHGLEKFVKLDKPADFIGKQALQDEIKRGAKQQFIMLEVDCDIAAAHAGTAILHQGKIIGSVTSGGYGFRVQKNIAFGFVDCGFDKIGTELQVNIIGEVYKARVVPPLY